MKRQYTLLTAPPEIGAMEEFGVDPGADDAWEKLAKALLKKHHPRHRPSPHTPGRKRNDYKSADRIMLFRSVEEMRAGGQTVASACAWIAAEYANLPSIRGRKASSLQREYREAKHEIETGHLFDPRKK